MSIMELKTPILYLSKTTKRRKKKKAKKRMKAPGKLLDLKVGEGEEE